MKGRKHSPEQIIRKLREADQLAGHGQDVAAVAKALEISEATLHRWRNQYGGMKAEDAKELKQLRGGEPAAEADGGRPGAADRDAAGGGHGKMVSPARRREAVLHLVERYGTSQRQACRALTQPRTTQRRPPRLVAAPEELLRARMKEISTKWPRWGFRRAHATLRQEGWKVNHKRVQRLRRDEGLRVPQQSPKRRRLGQSTVPADRLRAERANHVWALDFMFDTTSDGRPFKVLSMCDEFTKECLEGPLGRSITADAVVVALDKAALLRGLPEHIRCDNGPEFIAAAIQDWCRQSGAKTSFIDPGSPWQNPYVESFNSRAGDELFAREIFDSILEAKVLYADWCHAYNVHRPHSALSYQPPAAFAKAYRQS